MIKLSIITVTYNSEKYIEQTILSVINQHYSNIEYILIDGGSKDNTIKIIDKYKKFISYFISEPDRNMYDAINKGMRLATGDYIAVLNSDDYYIHDNVLDVVSKCLLEKKAYDGVYFDMIKVNSQGEKLSSVYRFDVNYKQLLFSRKLTFVGHESIFIKKELIDSLGGYADDTFSAAADYDYILRAFCKGIFCHYSMKILAFRIHDESITASGKIEMEVERVLKNNRYYDYSLFKRYYYYYYLWGKFVVLNMATILKKNFRRILKNG